MTEQKSTIDIMIDLCEEDGVTILDLFPNEFTIEYTAFKDTKEMFELALKEYTKKRLEIKENN